MSAIRRKLTETGYNQEEAYFHEKDRELIEKARKREGRPHLVLLQGGKQNTDLASQPTGRPPKKAA